MKSLQTLFEFKIGVEFYSNSSARHSSTLKQHFQIKHLLKLPTAATSEANLRNYSLCKFIAEMCLHLSCLMLQRATIDKYSQFN
ncbi:CLUMA_CG010405, isoform A [Clunio marinus]|uniref:CLUMA_CG010405, isoform A n=1 Tax=Clunio marinus TaxID=568069 RepID=A0A1J1IBM5_9DIPT|nr:CLUMA_CG010405, isoform A [Clunio marinus]